MSGVSEQFQIHDPQPAAETDNRLRRDLAAAIARFLKNNRDGDMVLLTTVVFTHVLDALWAYAQANKADENLFRDLIEMHIGIVTDGKHRIQVQ